MEGSRRGGEGNREPKYKVSTPSLPPVCVNLDGGPPPQILEFPQPKFDTHCQNTVPPTRRSQGPSPNGSVSAFSLKFTPFCTETKS